jgi:uncharacterized protein YceK
MKTIYIVCMLALIAAMSGCVTIDHVDQPETAYAGETIEIYIHAGTDSDEAESESPFGAVKIPHDWSVISCNYSGDYSGTMVYGDLDTAELEAAEPSGPDYKWWVGVGPDTCNDKGPGLVIATLIVKVGEPGEYLIDYKVGDRINDPDIWYDQEYDVPITVVPAGAADPDLTPTSIANDSLRSHRLVQAAACLWSSSGHPMRRDRST